MLLFSPTPVRFPAPTWGTSSPRSLRGVRRQATETEVVVFFSRDRFYGAGSPRAPEGAARIAPARPGSSTPRPPAGGLRLGIVAVLACVVRTLRAGGRTRLRRQIGVYSRVSSALNILRLLGGRRKKDNPARLASLLSFARRRRAFIMRARDSRSAYQTVRGPFELLNGRRPQTSSIVPSLHVLPVFFFFPSPRRRDSWRRRGDIRSGAVCAACAGKRPETQMIAPVAVSMLSPGGRPVAL